MSIVLVTVQARLLCAAGGVPPGKACGAALAAGCTAADSRRGPTEHPSRPAPPKI